MSTSLKINAKYLFVRDDQSPSGFLSKNRTSTDALNALNAWCAMAEGREYAIVSDSDIQLEANLKFLQSDISAGHDLDSCSSKFGVKREFVET